LPPAEELSSVFPESAEPHSTNKKGDLEAPVHVAFSGKARVLTNVLDPSVVEKYRLLRTKLLQQQQERMFRSLLVTSPGPREGKTVTTLNLALTFGLLPGCKVLVVDGDLRRGSLQDLLRVGPRPGLSDMIAGSTNLDEAIVKLGEVPVSFVLRGSLRLSPGELLHSARLPNLMHELTDVFDLVLVDSPPVNLFADAQLLASCCDRVLLVARAFSTSCKALEEASRALTPNQLIGTILNGGTKLSHNYGYGEYY
jgi:capsular exopolysaccharide synthesis family protein